MVFGLSYKLRYLCIDIQFDEILFAVVRKEGDFFQIDFTQKIIIEGGVFEGTHIQTPGKIADIFYEVKKRFGAIPVLANIPELFSYTTLLPKQTYSSHMDIQKAIQDRVSRAAYFWSCTFRKNGLSHTVVHASDKQVCDTVYSLIKSSGFMDITIYPRALALGEIEGIENSILCDFGTNQVSAFSLYGSNITYFSGLPFGSMMLDQKIKSRFSLAHDEVIEVLSAYGTNILPRKEGHVVHGIMHTFLAPITDEIQSLSVRRVEYGIPPTTQIFVSGTYAQYDGLIDDLAHMTHVEAKPIDVWKGVVDFDSYVPNIHKNESYKYAGIAGLMNILKKGTRYEPFDLR